VPVEVVKPGLATSVQDGGRSGYYHLGIPPSGAMDQMSYRAGNLLLGNPGPRRRWNAR
jgi:allophanate hydrolase subunit 2